ncbi:MAG TPA: CHAP domain-containing protein [Bdellovibrio sp.]|uniref:CHAP domain-containing protein n=1 Tax=Bdellovibrio sp. TaxID=28201 RepID=UPI002EF56805
MKTALLFFVLFGIDTVHAQVNCPLAKASLKSQASDIEKLCSAATPVNQAKGCSSADNTRPLKTLGLQDTAPMSKEVTWGNFGDVFDSFEGVDAYSNKPGTGGGKYQCTELAHRFMHDVYGVPTRLGIGLGDGDKLAKNMATRFKNVVLENPNTQGKKARLAYVENKCSGNAPVVGSMVSIKYSKWGHVGIVRDAKMLDDNHMQITLFEQHGVMRLKAGEKTKRTQFVLTKDASGHWSGPNVVGWINLVEI